MATRPASGTTPAASAAVGSLQRNRSIGRRTVKHRNEPPPPTVGQFDNGACIRLGTANRCDDRQVRLEMNQAFVIARRKLQINDALVARVQRVDRKMRNAIDLFKLELA